MRINEVDNPVTQADIDQLEVFADRLFAKVGIDVEFTRHFLDRVNDERNVKQITMSELTRLFKQEYKRWGKPIARLGPDAEAVMKDMATDINLPFALRWDHKNNELDLIAKTVMRKANFKTSNQEFAVEDGYKSLFRPSAYELAAERLHSVLQRKEKENGGVFRHALGWYAAKIASGFRDIDSRELTAYYQKNFDPVLSESDLPYIAEEAAPKLDYDQLKINIPANDNSKPKTGQVISLDDARAKAQAQLNSLSPAERKAANQFIQKNPSLLKRLANVGARATARHGVATLSSGATGPVAPATAVVLNVALLGWDIVDLGTELWKWSTDKSDAEVPRGDADAEWDPALQIEIPTTSPEQPNYDKRDPDNPEVPDSIPSDQPDIQIPQPLNAPQQDIPFIPPANVTDPEVAFQNDPVPVTVSPPSSGNSSEPSNNKNRRRKRDSDGSSDSDYNDPLQRWQRKYGMWDQ